jgi:hypothetical protein
MVQVMVTVMVNSLEDGKSTRLCPQHDDLDAVPGKPQRYVLLIIADSQLPSGGSFRQAALGLRHTLANDRKNGICTRKKD